jgi:PhzF family phenazine biosynthesis protein
VCVLPADVGVSLTDLWMANVAREMNLAETAYLWPEDDGYRLRWFTPAVEVDLCGHATLAAAHVLWENGQLKRSLPARFQTRSGLLVCTLQGEWIEMDFPATPSEASDAPPEIAEALGVALQYSGRTKFDYFVEVADESTLRGLQPNLSLLKKFPVRGFIVTARGDSDYDFVSRFFAPGAGIDEDPVTGSAHCALAPYWTAKLGQSELIGYQASPRGGTVKVKMQGDRVLLQGQAVTVLRGELFA